MRFALLGDHSDGLEAARALAASGRHALVVYSGPQPGLDYLARDGLAPRRVGDLEEVLADPAIEAVIVAGAPAERVAQLRRALQSERHVLCVHPADPSPDVAYEAALMQSDVRRVLLPLLPEALHPGIQRLAALARAQRGDFLPPADEPAPRLPPGFPRLIECERASTEELLLEAGHPRRRAGLPGWDAVRLVGGEIAEVAAQGRGEDLLPGEPVLVTGRFVAGSLLQARWLPNQAQASWRMTLVSDLGRSELLFPEGWPGPASLHYTGGDGLPRQESWHDWHPWRTLVETFEAELETGRRRRETLEPGRLDVTSWTQPDGRLGWFDAVRALELDDAVRRSLERGRAISLDFPEATEEASFKGTMTLVGCGLLWLSVLLLILSVWAPALGLAVLPLFGVFLLLQFLGWAVPRRDK